MPGSSLHMHCPRVVVGLLMVVSVANLTYISQQGNRYPADFAAPVVQFFVYSLIMILVLLHKIQGVQVSYLLFFVSLLLVLCQTPQMYSYIRIFLNSDFEDIYLTAVNITVYALHCALLILQFFCDKPPIYNEYPNLERPSPESLASVPSRLTYSWFTPLVKLGAKKPLEASDMFTLNHENTSKVIVSRFDKNWVVSVEKTNRPKVSYDKRSSKVGFYRTVRPQTSILSALCKTFGPSFLMGSLLKLFQDIVVFINPQLLNLVISFVSSDESLWKGCMYAALMFITSIVQMFLLNRYFLTMNFVGIRITTALISAIYRKSLKLSNAARKQSTLGEVVNLMAVDASAFQQLMVSLNLVWSAPLQITLALYFLWQLLGPAVLAGLAVMILMVPVNVWLVRQNRRLRIKQMKYKDERIKIMNEVLSGIKVLKLYAWEPSFEQKITNIRQKEINVLKTAVYYNTCSIFVFSMTPYLVALASFAFFVLYDDHNILDAQTAFVSLSLFNILRFPLAMLPQVMNSLVLTAVSMKRINKFLNNEELDPHSVTHDNTERDPIVVEDGTFSWESGDDNSIVLRNINVRVPASSLVAVVGSVGSGKSSLLAAVLGEMDKLSGKVNTKKFNDIFGIKNSDLKVKVCGCIPNVDCGLWTSYHRLSNVYQWYKMFSEGREDVNNEQRAGHLCTSRTDENIDEGSIAYVPQLAWIQNATLRKNITCAHEFDMGTFKKVVKACALEQDLEMLPGGDMTEIGEKGINLSGGQKQRISLARAVYSKADVYLLDDPLSAVDSHVGKHIFENVIGPYGVLRKKTRVLVTHGVTFLPETDLIIVMKDGQVAETGSYQQLVKSKGAFADFLLQYLEQADEPDGKLEEIREELLKDPSLRDKYTRAISVRSEESNKSNSLQR
ncbi:Canalicular multispecific organic anion transporter 1 [Homalodisca vitripennis]|nr:Canalicular multispecific organic anion transporter 1 [Homalodisca vitripennis]